MPTDFRHYPSEMELKMWKGLLIALSLTVVFPTLSYADVIFYSFLDIDSIQFGAVSDNELSRSNRRPTVLIREDALRLANARQRKLVKDSEALQWGLKSIQLKTEGVNSYWLVEYVQSPRPGIMLSGVAGFLRILVLMDGTVIEPRFRISRPNLPK
jgi:hypothetical protein